MTGRKEEPYKDPGKLWHRDSLGHCFIEVAHGGGQCMGFEYDLGPGLPLSGYVPQTVMPPF